MSDSIKISLDNSKVKVKQRSRKRMKIEIKLSAEEAQGFQAFVTVVKPPEVSDEDFVKQIFFLGINTLDSKLQQMVEEYKAKNGVLPPDSAPQTEETPIDFKV